MNPYNSFGEAEVFVDGKSHRMPQITYKMPGKINNSVDNGQGFTKQSIGGYIKGSIRLMPGMSVEQLKNQDDVTVHFTTDTGQAYTASHAWVEGAIDVTGGEGFEVTFAFKKCTEVTNG